MTTNPAVEYEIGEEVYVTRSPVGVSAGFYIYEGRAANSNAYHVLRSQNNNRYIVLSNSALEEYAQKYVPTPRRGEVWNRKGAPKRSVFNTSRTVVEVTDVWVIFATGYDPATVPASPLLARTIEDFTEKYEREDS